MPYNGIILHHSVCPSINGKGYDFFITAEGSVIPAAERTDLHFIHVCLEGDFSSLKHEPLLNKDQFFVLLKLVLRLSAGYGFRPEDIYPHSFDCPGPYFPWGELVISDQDGYH